MISDFDKFSQAIADNLANMSKKELFIVQTDDLFQVYLNAFPEGTNPIYKERAAHDCSCCKQFVRNMGNIISITNGEIKSVWDVDGLPYPYDVVAKALSEHVKDKNIETVFRSNQNSYGAAKTLQLVEDRTISWNHFVGKVERKHYTKDVDTVRGRINSAAHVFKRGLTELTESAVETVLDLIDSNSLYRGAEHKSAVQDFKKLQDSFKNAHNNPDVFIWENIDSPVARFRNTVIGTLVQDISDGMDIEKAVRMFESKVAPQNYKRPTAIYTQTMVKNAVKTLEDLGLESALNRRYARIDDVSVNNVLFVDNSVKPLMKGIEGLLMSELKTTTKPSGTVEDIAVDDFLNNILPNANSVEVFFENKHMGNFVSLTAPVEDDVNQLFKWKNNFAWSYDGEVADSIKQRVKSAGGNVSAKMRCSLAWFNYDDLDIHVHEPNGNHIYYGNRESANGDGLDVDMNVTRDRRDAVENVCWDYVADGKYRIEVNNFTPREQIDVGFVLEFEIDGAVQTFTYDKRVVGYVPALTLTAKKGVVEVACESGVKRGNSSNEKWGITSEQFVRVDTIMLSPNHWDGEKTGNKHLFFFIKDCNNPDTTRGIYNEFLNPSLEQHGKVFEMLGAKSKCPQSDTQLSGLGFSSTRGDTVVVKVQGDKLHKTFNVKF